MKLGASIGRGFAAIVLTGIVSPLIFAAGFVAFGLAQTGRPDLSGIVDLVSFIWLVGSFIALPCAVVIGLCVEWPKSYWLLKRPSAGWWVSFVISLLAFQVLLHSLLLADLAMRVSVSSADLADSLAFMTCAAAVGGACSAAFWWWLVVMPGRKGRGSSA
jgi:hypothetical protein